MVKRALEGLKGVTRADVSLRDKEAHVLFDPALVSVEQLIEVLKPLGYEASVKRQSR